MRRPRSTASSPLCRPPRWSGTTKMSSWQTSLGTLRTRSFPLSPPLRLNSFLSRHTSSTSPSSPPPTPALSLVLHSFYKRPDRGMSLNPMSWNSYTGLPALPCAVTTPSRRMDSIYRNIILGRERGNISWSSPMHHLSAASSVTLGSV